MRGRDEKKDQSYFLYQLRQEQLKHILFPIGEMTKMQVREKARELNLPVAEKPDSQGICFVGPVSVREFLKELGMKQRVGEVVMRVLGENKARNTKHEIRNKTQMQKVENIVSLDLGWQIENLAENYGVVGQHEGAGFYTVGQRVGVANKLTTNS